MERWPAGEIVERARKYFAYTLTEPLPKPGESTVERFLVGAAIGMCCTDALLKLKNEEKLKVVTDNAAWGVLTENYISVAYAVRTLFTQQGYETEDFGETFDGLKVVWQSVAESVGLPPEEVDEAWTGIPTEGREAFLLEAERSLSEWLQPLLTQA